MAGALAPCHPAAPPPRCNAPCPYLRLTCGRRLTRGLGATRRCHRLDQLEAEELANGEMEADSDDDDSDDEPAATQAEIESSLLSPLGVRTSVRAIER